MKMPKYQILRVLNNSSLLVTDGKSESIIVSKGIGYKKKPNDFLDSNIIIEKEYHLLSDTDYQTQSKVSKEIIQNTAAIVDIVSDAVDCELSVSSIKALSNHVAAMLVRIENDEIFANPFHHETKTLYAEGYQIALVVAQKVKKTIGVQLPEAEIDFLTLYIHGIKSSFGKEGIVLRNAIISDISETVEDVLGFEIDKSSTLYARFITHIKFLIQRLLREEPIQSVPMIEEIAKQYPDYMVLSQKIAAVIEKHLKQKLSPDEHVYIALHLARLAVSKPKK